jgi:hypothetical protein
VEKVSIGTSVACGLADPKFKGNSTFKKKKEKPST